MSRGILTSSIIFSISLILVHVEVGDFMEEQEEITSSFGLG